MMCLLSLRNLLFCVTLACLVPGCGGISGPPLGTVSGKITMNGAPVPGVTVTFAPKEKGSSAYGGTDENGEYHLMFNQNRSGAQLGLYDVIIESREPKTDDSGRPISPTPPVKVSKKYRVPGALSAEVKSGHNTFDFTLDAANKP